MKEQLRRDLTAAMKARDKTRVATLRMALAAVMNAEVAGDTARELSDAEIITVLNREVRKRQEAAETYDGAGRPELAEQERAEQAVLAEYLPAPLSDAEVEQLAEQAVAQVRADSGEPVGMRQMGRVVGLVQSRAAGRADGARIAAAVRGRLTAG